MDKKNIIIVVVSALLLIMLIYLLYTRVSHASTTQTQTPPSSQSSTFSYPIPSSTTFPSTTASTFPSTTTSTPPICPFVEVDVDGNKYFLSNNTSSGQVVITGNSASVSLILSNGSPNSQYSVLEDEQFSGAVTTGSNISKMYTETTNSAGSFTLDTELILPSSNTTLTATYTITGPGIRGSFIFTVILGPPLPSSSPSPSPSSYSVTFNNPCNCPFEVIGFNPNYPPTATRPAPVDEYIEPLLSVTIPYTPPMVFQIWNLVNDGPVAQYTNPTGTVTLSCANCGNFSIRH